MSDKIKAGVIGTGLMGSTYARLIKTLRDVELVGIMDVNEKQVTDLAKELNTRPYMDAVKLFDIEKPEIVVISCPDEFHAHYTLLALEKNINVHLEKPVADSLENCNKILNASKKSKAKFNIGYILRILPQYSYIRERVKSGKFGEIIHFYTRRNGIMKNEGLRWQGRTDLPTYLVCHDADIMMWVTGNKVLRVYGEEVTGRSLKKFNTHDSIQVVLKCEDGSIGVIECCWAVPDIGRFSVDNRMEIVGTKEVAYVDLQEQGLIYLSEEGMIWPGMVFAADAGGFFIGGLRNEFEKFIDSIVYDKPVMCSVEEGIEATKVAIASKISIRENIPVYLKDIK
jgi:UDP-N-acetylglucosamine 3-dehydrogenase